MSFERIRNHKVLSILGAFFALLALLAVAAVLFAEPLIKSFIETSGSGKTGREFSIEGPFDLKMKHGHVAVHAEKVRLSNAEGYKEEDMMRIEKIDFTINPFKLLIGRVEIDDMIVEKPYLVLDKKDADNKNWDFPALSKANALSEAAVPDDRSEFPLIGKLVLKAGNLIYRDAVKGLDLDLKLDSVSGNDGEKSGKNGFVIEGNGSLQEQKFFINASGGSLDTLRDSNKDFPLNMKLVMGPTEVLVDGTFKDPVKMTGINASLEVKGHNMADLFYLTAIPLPPTPPYLLKGRLTKTGEVWGYEDFTGKVGDSDLSGTLSYDTGGERGYLKADLLSHLLDSDDLGGFIGLPPSAKPGETAAPEQKKEAAENRAKARLIPDVPLKLERLRATDMDVTLKAEKINAPGLPFKGMDVKFNLKNGLLKLDPLNVVLADGTVDGAIEIDGQKDVPPMKMNLNLHRLSLGQFFRGTRFEKTTQGYFGGRADLAGQGLSLAQVLGTSNGEFTIIMAGGRISLLLVEAADLDIAQAAPLFLGEDKSTAIRCGVADFNVKNGLLSSKVFILDTDDSLLVGTVGIDLKRELINAKLDAKPKDPSPLSVQAPIVVSGKLKKPSVGLDAANAGARGAAAAVLGALLTPFAAIIPFIETGKVQNADCRRLISQAKN